MHFFMTKYQQILRYHSQFVTAIHMSEVYERMLEVIKVWMDLRATSMQPDDGCWRQYLIISPSLSHQHQVADIVHSLKSIKDPQSSSSTHGISFDKNVFDFHRSLFQKSSKSASQKFESFERRLKLNLDTRNRHVLFL